ncbi:MAG: sulfotransferase domain-containing protein [Pirellulaceae bacterium]
MTHIPHIKVPDLGERRIGFFMRKWIAMATHTSYLLGHIAPKRIPMIVVNGFPKSGTVWVTQMVADYLQYPFHDLSFFPIGSPGVLHGHYQVRKKGPPMVYVVRDGRDTMVSMYFHMTRNLPDGDNPRMPAGYARHLRGLKNKNQIREFLPEFIRRQFNRSYGCRSNWNQHVRSFLDSKRDDVPLVRYEDLLSTPFETMATALKLLTQSQQIDEDALGWTIQKFSFQRQSGRRSGEENANAFVRKGQAGDWRNHFSREAAEVFNELGGETLIQLGYESNKEWVKQT